MKESFGSGIEVMSDELIFNSVDGLRAALDDEEKTEAIKSCLLDPSEIGTTNEEEIITKRLAYIEKTFSSLSTNGGMFSYRMRVTENSGIIGVDMSMRGGAWVQRGRMFREDDFQTVNEQILTEPQKQLQRLSDELQETNKEEVDYIKVLDVIFSSRFKNGSHKVGYKELEATIIKQSDLIKVIYDDEVVIIQKQMTAKSGSEYIYKGKTILGEEGLESEIPLYEILRVIVEERILKDE